MEMLSLLLALCEGNPLIIGRFLPQRPVMQSFGVSVDVSLNMLINSQVASDLGPHGAHVMWLWYLMEYPLENLL